METMSQFATKADLFEARSIRFAKALVDVMSAMQDHDIKGETGLSDADCESIADARRDAAILLGVTAWPNSGEGE